MYTACPICQTVFRVTEAQLERAGGRVRCGQCQHVFNARDNLHSEPPCTEATAPSDEETPTPAAADSISPAEVTVHEAALPPSETEDVIAEVEHLDLDLSAPPAHAAEDEERDKDFDFDWPQDEEVEEITLEGPPLSHDKAEAELHEEAVDEGASEVAGGATTATPGLVDDAEPEEPTFDEEPEAETTISRAWLKAERVSSTEVEEEHEPAAASDESLAPTIEEFPPAQEAGSQADRLTTTSDDIPLVLRDALAATQRPPRSRWLTASSIALSVLLISTLLAQLAFYSRSSLIQRYPALTPFAQQLCARIGCEIELPRDVSRVVVVSRDVRSHPTVSGALLITATINNEAAFAQPCPDVELSLFDLTGTLVAQRRFAPKEYLDDAPQPGAVPVMQPDRPVRLRLEVRDPGQHAINYEFTFL